MTTAYAELIARAHERVRWLNETNHCSAREAPGPKDGALIIELADALAALTRELEEARTQLEARWLDTKSPLMRDIIENGRWAAGIEEAAEMAEQYGREYISKPCAMLAEALREKLLSRERSVQTGQMHPEGMVKHEHEAHDGQEDLQPPLQPRQG